MIRSRIFNCRIPKQLIDNYVLFKNNSELNCRNSCQCFSTTKLVSNNDKESATSTLLHDLKNQNINLKKSDREFLVRLKNDPDSFGQDQEEEIIDKGDMAEEQYFTEQPDPSQRLRTKQYADLIKDMIRKRRIKEAIDFVERKMIKEDRVKPEGYIFNLLLGACGRVGYTKKAFMLYNDMKKRGLNIMGGTYTALFNACSNSPWATTDGLSRAHKLRSIMIEKGHDPNSITYNAMIKAFGRCGDLSTAFSIADEMLSKKRTLKDDTINFLLQACVTDKEAGFRHALLVWRKLVDRKIKPSIYTYNTLLRCVRDCGLGDIEVTQDVINRLISGDIKQLSAAYDSKLLGNIVSHQEHQHNEQKNASEEHGSNDTDIVEPVKLTETSNLENTPIEISRPNLLAKVPHLGSIISLSEVKKPEDRLILIGGCRGFIENMEEHGCTPDIKTITQLIDCIPPTAAAEKELLVLLARYKIKPDIDFYNILMKKKCMRFDYEGAKEVLQLMQQRYRYRPDVVTYGVMALGCKTREQCIELIEEMKEKRYSLNVEILGAMLRQACVQQNFDYVMCVMDLFQSENVNPDEKCIAVLHEFRKRGRYLFNNKKLDKKDGRAFLEFKKNYTAWKEQIHVDKTEDIHPWQQFRQPVEGNPKYVTKDTARFKPVHASKFKVKTSPKSIAKAAARVKLR